MAIAHPIRRGVLQLLREGELAATQLAEPFRVSQPAISQQLKVLKDVGLVSERRHGRQRIYRLRPEPLREVLEWASQYREFVDPSGHAWVLAEDRLGANRHFRGDRPI